MNWNFDEPLYFLILLLIPVVFFATKFQNFRKNRSQKNFADEHLLNYIFPKQKRNFWWILNPIFILLISISLVDIISGFQKINVKNKGYDIVFALDISNSMNCEDLLPSRLEKAKKLMLNILEQNSESKFGIIIFAGEAYTLLPLTYDKNAVELNLKNITTELIDIQGTDLGIALKEAAGLFNKNQKKGKIIVLISDGEDHEGNEDSGIDYIKDQNIHVISVGMGTQKGGTIPYFSQGVQMGNFTDENGETVISKLQKKSLQKIANKTNGNYLSSIDNQKLSKLITDEIQLKSKKDFETIDSSQGERNYTYFLALALLVFFIISLTQIKNDFNI